MKTFGKIHFSLIAIGVLSLALAGCKVDDSSMTRNITPPSKDGDTEITLPRVSGFSSPSLVTFSTGGTVDTANPTVSNVSASQVADSTNVTITYDLSDDTTTNLTVEIDISDHDSAT